MFKLNEAKTSKIAEIQAENIPRMKLLRQKSLEVLDDEISLVEKTKSDLASSAHDGKLNDSANLYNSVANSTVAQAQIVTDSKGTAPLPATRASMSTPSRERRIELTRDGKTETKLIPIDITFRDFKTSMNFKSREGHVLCYTDKEDHEIILTSEQDWTYSLNDMKCNDLFRVHERKVRAFFFIASLCI
jgi:hypothetical protein